VATQSSNRTFYIEIDGVNVSGTITVPNTTGWQKWQTVTANNIALTSGLKKMRIVFVTGGFNINYVNTLVSTSTDLLASAKASTSNYVYPNPGNQFSIIHFTLKNTGKTKITLLNEIGMEYSIVNDEFLQAGEHEIIINRGSLSSGFYVCKIQNEADLINLKMILE
jgi:hypothetical protein